MDDQWQSVSADDTFDYQARISVEGHTVPVFSKGIEDYCVLEHGNEYKIELLSKLPGHRVSAKIWIDGIQASLIK